MKTESIYIIKQDANGKVYVGCSLRPFKRWKRHVRKDDEHRDEQLSMYGADNYGLSISQAIQRYGVENFSFKIVEDGVKGENLYLREKYWIEFYDSFYNGYNLSKGSENREKFVHKKGKVDRELALKIYNEYNNNYHKDKSITYQFLADKYGLCIGTIGIIARGEHHTMRGELSENSNN